MFSYGQKVTCFLYGEGVVDSTNGSGEHPIVAKFINDQGYTFTETYTTDGKLYSKHSRQFLYPGEVDIKVTATVKQPLNKGDVVKFQHKENPSKKSMIGVVSACDVFADGSIGVVMAFTNHYCEVIDDDGTPFDYDRYDWEVLGRI